MERDVKMVLLFLSIWIHGISAVTAATGSVVSPPDNKGQQFILMFMENLRIGTQKFPLELYVTTAEKHDVHVHVTSPKWSSPKVDETFTITDGDVQKVTLDSIFRMVGDSVDPKALLVTADGDVACYGANKETLSNDVYLGLPVDALGTDYYAVAYSPASIKTEIGMAITQDGTNLDITLPTGNGNLNVTFKGHTYRAGDTIHVNANKFDAVQLQSVGDLTGAHIQSNKPIAAFSGNIKTTVDIGNFSDHLVEQLVPTDRWGEKFVTAPTPQRTVGDVFKIIAKADNTVVRIPGKAPVHLNKGGTYQFELPSNQYSSITSTQPIMLAQFVKTQRSGSEPADPSMMIIPPYEQFGSDYTFTTPEYSHPEYGPTFRYQNEFMIVAKKTETSGLLLDGKPFPQTTWHDIPGTDLVGSSVTLPHGAHTVRHSDPLSTFGGYLYGHAYHESYGFPTGMRTAVIYDPHCKPTPSVPGDGIDNDCDNKIDEELCTPDNHGKDDDGDGKSDEDCVKTTPIDGLWGKWGRWGSTCSVTCGDGVVSRTRMCDSPAPKFGGKNCTGMDTQTKTCYGGTPCGLDIAAICSKNPRAVVANPLNCAQYFDCAKTSPFGQLHLFECPYPQLFSNVSLRCGDFPSVTCGRRKEPKAPCEYLQNKCNGSDPSCKPCPQRLASCVGDPDGRQAMAVFSPEYKDCKTDRTMGQGKCPMGYFNPQAHKCLPHNPGTLSFYCRQHKTAMLGEPHSCAKYYDCSKPGSTLAQKTAECTYPDLFSIDTGHCENFTTVNCTTRPEPEAPCEYDQNKCLSTNHTCKPCPQVHANCVGLSDGMQSYPGRQWGPDYAQCLLNRTMSQGKCPSGQYFHPLTKKCTDKVKPGEVPDVCRANPNMVFADEQNCAKYYDCSANHSSLGNHMVECTYPDLFSTTTKRCEQFDKVTCGKRLEPMAPCEYDQNKCKPGNSSCVPCSRRLPSCVGQADGNQTFTTREWKPDYVICSKNRTLLPTKKCTKGYYHPVLKICKEDVSKPDAKPYCQANPTVVVPMADNCAQYIDCPAVNAGGSTANPVSECKYPDLFSTTTMTCESFTTVTCNLRKEPQAPCEYDQNKCQPNDPTCVPCAKRLPSCVGLNDGDNAFVTREWKPDYVTCNKNRTMLPTKKCTKGYFHPMKKICTEDIANPDAKPYCKANPMAIAPMKDNCAQFINCTAVNQRLTANDPVQECKYPDLFSTLSLTCQDFTTVSCDKRREPQAPCEYKQNVCNTSDPSCIKCSDRLPSCVTLQDGDHMFPTRQWKPDYVTCYKNRTIIPTKTCPSGAYFHPTLQRCTKDVKKPDAKPYCQANPVAIVPTADDCAQYINCSQVNALGTMADPVQECDYPDLFSTTTMHCQDFTTVSCGTRREPQAPCEYKQNLCATLQTAGCIPCQQRLPSCIQQADGNQPFPGKQWKQDFIHCYKNRTMSVDKCPSGAIFDPMAKACTTKINSKNADPFCSANPTAVKINPVNCAQYYNCSAPAPPLGHHLVECKYPDLFSAVSMRCEQFDTVHCTNRTEPQAPCEYMQNLCSQSDPTCVRCPNRLPSCVGLSDGNHPFPSKEWKPDYVTCYKNRTVNVTKCQDGYFHPNDRNCSKDVKKPDAKPYCIANPNDVLPMPGNCAQVLNCTSLTTGSAMDPVQECKYPDLFSTVTKTCQDFTTVQCDKRPEPQAPCQYQKLQSCSASASTCPPCPDRLPSCIGLADGVHVFPGKLWMPDHITCYKNRTNLPLDKCSPGMYFHPTKKVCTKDITKVDATPYCKAHPHSIIPMADNCAHYIDCPTLVGSPAAQPISECKYPDLFSSVTMTCQSFTTVTCDTRPEPQAPCEYDQNLCAPNDTQCQSCPLRLPSCIGKPDGAQPFPTRLWKSDYVQCYKNRTMALRNCPQGDVFDPQHQACITKVPASKMDSFCQANPTVVMVNPDNCAQYFNCSDNSTRLGHHLDECKYPDLFSQTTHSCERFDTVSCTTRKEPKAPCEYQKNVCKPNDTTCTPCPDRLPSCVGLSDGDHAFPTRMWAPDYITCYKERTVNITKCQTGYFHPADEMCKTNVTRPDAKKFCQSNPTAIVPTTDDCAQYFNCSSSDPVQECHYPELFSTVTMSCQDFTTVHCDKRTEPRAPCEYKQNLCDSADLSCTQCKDRLPSCVGVPDGDHAFPGRLWKPDFITCYNNRTVIPTKKCSHGFFHPIHENCTENVTKPDATPYCQANPREVLPTQDNCAKFYNCTRTLLGYSDVTQECTYPDLFSAMSMTCQDFTTVQCDKRLEPQAPCEYDQNQCPTNDPSCAACPTRLPSCVGLPDGDQVAAGYKWTDVYVRCYKNRTMSVEHCPNGAVFDPSRKICVSKIRSGDIASFCQSNPSAVKPHDTNCAQYYNCSSPHSPIGPYTEECPYPDLFSTTTRRCEQFETVPCGTRHEPQPPCEYLHNRCNGSDPNCPPCQERLPSCVGLPDGYNPVANKVWGPEYIDCYKNRTMAVKNCTTQYFHPTQKKCVDKLDRGDVKDFCKENPTAIVPAEDNCAQYYNCSQPASDVISECKYPDLFSRFFKACGPFRQTQCDTRPEPQAPCEYDKNLCPKSDPTCEPCPERLPSCVGQPTGANPHPYHRWGDVYVECYLNRTMAVTKCKTGYFHPRNLQCTTQVDPVDVPDYCAMHSGEIITNPGNCATYYNCSSSNTGHVIECKYPELYDVTTKACADFTTVVCNNRPEPMAPCQYKQNRCDPSDSSCVPCPDRLPSCVGLSDGNHAFQGHVWEPDYVTCNKNRTSDVNRCKTGYFHPRLRTCVTRIDKPDMPDFCAAHPFAIIPNPDNCAQYVNCSDPGFMKECTYPDLFAADTMTCTKFMHVDCDVRPEPQAPCEYAQNQCPPGDTSCTPCPQRLPSCVGTPDGAQPFTGREWTDDYIECFKNRTMSLNKCPPGSVFDATQKACVSRIDKSAIQSFCQYNSHALKEQPDNCAQYFDCSKPTSPLGPYLMECDYPQLYNAQFSMCVDFGIAHCDNKKEPQAPCDYLRNLCSPKDPTCVPCPSRLPSCVGLPDGTQPHQGRIWEPDYVECRDNRTVNVQKCAKGYFHPQRKVCVDKITQVDIPSYCQAHRTAIIEDPRSCSRYFNCSAMTTPLGNHQMECSYPDLFSATFKSCMQFQNVDCQNKPEPQAPCEYVTNLCDPSDPHCVPCPQRLPSCKGSPDGNNPRPGSLWKADYIVCYKNRTVYQEKCTHGFFNPRTLTCVDKITPVDANQFCHSNPTEIFPDPNSCSKYYNCSDVLSSSSGPEECPYPDLFSKDTKSCEPFNTVTCQQRPEPQAPCEYDQNLCPSTNISCVPCPARLPSCVGLTDGQQTFGIQVWSDKYIECSQNRTVAVKKCPSGTYFSPQDKKCTRNVNKASIPDFCRANPTIVRPHPNNCAQYYDCSALAIGSEHLKECPYPDLFDTTTLTCKPFATIQCGVRYEPKQPCEYVKNQCTSSHPNCKPCPERQPSCVGLSDGNHPFPGMIWHQQFIVCDHDRTIMTTLCPGTAVFNPNTKHCVDVTHLTKYEFQDYCKAYPTAVLADPSDCSRYYDCKQVYSATRIQFQCNYPDLFSIPDKRCVNFTQVQCGTRKEPTAPCEYDQNLCKPTDTTCVPCPSRLPDCKGLPDGNNGVPGELWSVNYIHCEKDRTLEVKQCQQGVFDPTARNCSTTVGPQHMQDICTNNPRIIIQHPTNCAQYFNCSVPTTRFGHYLMECDYPDLFDAVTQQCRPFTTVQCGAKTEPQAPCQYFQNLCLSGNHSCTPCKDRLPSCVGLPNGPNAIPNKQWSNEYVECNLNRTVSVRPCRTGSFDPVKRSCVDSVDPVDIPKYCAANPKATLHDPNNCAKYYDCNNPTSNYRHECKYPMLFSDQTSACDDFRSVFCGSRPQPQTPCEYTQNQCALGDLTCVPCQNRLPSCKGLPDGINGDPNRLWTSAYIQCLQNRTVTERACADGVFDPMRRSCVKYVDPSKINDVCRANPTSVFPDPTNCAKYYDCRSLQSFSAQLLKECQYPDLFSTTSLSCQRFDTVRCNNRQEPQAPCEYSQNRCTGGASCVPCDQRHSSCVGLPDGPNAFQTRLWSGDYVVCDKNRTMKVEHCAPGAMFDPLLRRCSDYVDPARVPEFCRAHPTTVVPSGGNAAQFYNCSAPSGGLPEPYVHECDYPDLFDDRYLICRPFTQVPTDKRPEPQAPCQYEKNLCLAGSIGCTPCPQRLYSCIDLPDGLNGIEGKSWVPDYINCYKNRTIGNGKCEHGVFDPLQRQCVAKTQPGPISIPEQCRRDPQKLIPHPGSCSLYYNCSQTISRFGPFLPTQLQECKYPDLFSAVYQRCMDFQSVKCDGRNEVQAPCQYLQNQCDPTDVTCEPCPKRLPSCVGLPDGNNAVIGQEWSRDYVHCFKNRTLGVSTCRTGYFHPAKRTCTNTLDKGDVNDFCKSNPAAVMPNAGNCAKFHDCAKLTNRYQAPSSRQSANDECRYPDLFSTITNRCVPFTRVNCDQRPEPQAPCEYDQNQCDPSDSTCEPCSTRLPSCVGLGEGNVAIPGREYTESYVSCHLNRTMGVNKCQKGFFDAGVRLCVTNINSANIRPYCKTNPHAVLPHPTNCAWYYNCSVTGRTPQGVYPYDVDYTQECPYPQLFSSATMKCEQFPRVSCNGHFEPQAPCEYIKNRCDPASSGCVPCPNRLFSCKDLPDGQQILTNLADRQKYLVECQTNRTLSSEVCKPSMYQCAGVFPKSTAAPATTPSTPALAASTTPTPDAVKSYCRSHPYDVVAHETNCAMFYDCNDLFTIRMLTVKECHYPLLFNPIVHACTDFHTTRCGGKYEPQAPCEYVANQCHGGACIPCAQTHPSCVGLSDGTHPFPGEDSSYIRCQGNRTMATENCPANQIYDDASKRCKEKQKAGGIQDYCRLHPFGRLLNAESCAQFFDCAQENGPLGHYKDECAYPNLFDGILMTCRDRSQVRCGSRPTPATQCDYRLYSCVGFGCPSCSGQTPVLTTTPAPTTPTPQTGPSCVGRPNGLNPYPGRPMTGHYLVCENGQVIETGICIVDKILDPVQRRCTDPANPDVIDAYCRIHPGSVIPSVDQCAQYYTCGNDVLGRVHERKECRYPQLFSTIDKTCKTFSNVQCGQRVEPVAPCDYQQNQCSPSDTTCVPCSQRMTSCVGLPDGPNPLSRTSLSPNYIVCDTGRTVEFKRCPMGYFDPSYRTCKGNTPVLTTRPPYVYTMPTTPTTPPTTTTQAPTGPNCVGKPDGLNPYPGRPLTGHYIVCDRGQVVDTGICIVDKVLDPVKRRCSYPASPDVIDNYCNAHPGTSIPSVTNCAQYYTCTRTFFGTSHEQHECPYPQLFSTVDNTCKSYTSVQCGQRIEPVSPCDYSANQCSSSDPSCVPCSQRMPSCVGLPDGPNPYPNVQSSPNYVVCNSGRTTQTLTCATGYFDGATRTCKTQSLDKVSTFCRMRPTGTMRDDNNCAQYYTCSTENTRLGHYKQECPYPELFDDILNMCRDRAYVRCGTRSAPQSPCDYKLYECIGIDCQRCPGTFPLIGK